MAIHVLCNRDDGYKMLSPQVEGMYFFYFKCSAAVARTGYDNRQNHHQQKSSQVISGNDVALYRAFTIASMAKLNLRCSKAIPMQKKIGHDDLKLKNAKMLCSSIKFLSNLWDSIWKW